MPIATKQLTSDEVWKRLRACPEFSEEQGEEWKNQVASDLNHLVGHAIWNIETDTHHLAVEFGAAVLRIVERVVEFEKIKSKGRVYPDLNL